MHALSIVDAAKPVACRSPIAIADGVISALSLIPGAMGVTGAIVVSCTEVDVAHETKLGEGTRRETLAQDYGAQEVSEIFNSVKQHL